MATDQATLREEWKTERARLAEKLTENRDPTGWPLSPEARTYLRQDIRECDRIIGLLDEATDGV